MGHLQVNGTISTVGQSENSGTGNGYAGYIGPCSGGESYYLGGPNNADLISGGSVNGAVTEMPALAIINDGGVFSGIPSDMRGSSSPDGTDLQVYDNGSYFPTNGGSGGTGGGGIVITCRGMGFGAAGELNISGSPGGAGTQEQIGPLSNYSDSGGGGAPGGAILLVDTNGSVSFPVVAGNVIANWGNSPGPNSGKGGDVLGVSAVLAMYVPNSSNGYPS